MPHARVASLAVREPLVEAQPDIPNYPRSLGETYLHRLGAGAMRVLWKETWPEPPTPGNVACVHYDGSKSLIDEQTFSARAATPA